ncbi:MAG TPA: alpha/beta fold hydrolase [Mycobacteriales bacterium]|nr:alpha/beta fold hydrolase [Mycobacteriales bacterium]
MSLTPVQSRKSTTVRSRWELGAVRAAFAILDRVAPGLGSRWAIDLWCTLPGNAGRRRDDRPAPGAPSSLDVAGRSVAVEAWGAGDPVYLVHGWGGWRGQLGGFVTPLVEAGFRVMAFDAPGHGDSGPSGQGPGRGNGVEFVDSLRAVTAEFGLPRGVIAHSFGCATTATAIGDGLRVGRLVCVSPSVDPMTNIRAVAQAFGIGPRVLDRLPKRIERLAGRPLSDFDPRTVTGRRPPTLVIHDRRDKEVPYAEGAAFGASWPTAELISTDGLGHQRILRNPGVIDRAVGFLAADR